MKINTIYQEGNFEFNQNYSIKIEEKTIFLNQNLESLQLLSQNTINHHRKKFNYIHIGLVQVAIKPFFLFRFRYSRVCLFKRHYVNKIY